MTGADKDDPLGAAVSGASVTLSTDALLSGGAMAVTFDAVVQ